MKRFTAMIFCLALSVGMVGCAGQTNDNNAEPPVQQETEAAPETQEPQENVENVEMVFNEADHEPVMAEIPEEKLSVAYVTEGTEEYQGFLIDNVLHSENEGDIHYNVYFPESYDGSKSYALYFTLPGYEGLYFQGVAVNLKSEAVGFEAQKYNSEMIIVAPQLSDWGETSANQTIALVEYFLEHYNIDTSKVYGNGFSGGGETMSRVVGKRPDLFTAYLQVSSQWDGEFEPVAEQRLPVYFAIGRNDEYYGLEDNALILSRNNVADSENTVVQWAESLGIQSQAPLPSGSGDTVATATVTPGEKQVLQRAGIL